MRRPLRHTKAINETGSPGMHNVYAKDSSASRRRIVRAVTFLLALSTLMFSLVLLRPVGASSEGVPQEAISQDAAVAEAEALAAGSGCVTPQFALAGPPFAAGNGPTSLAAGDFNNDGKTDLAIADGLSNTVMFRFGNGAGSFPTSSNETVGNNPVFVAVSDFNKDGKQDLAVVNQGSDNVSILSGNGAGSFLAGAPVIVGDSPRAAVVGDFNEDGNQDLAVANEGSDNVSIRLGDGAGGFTSGADLSAGVAPVFLATGDFNRDGDLDLVVVNKGSDNVSVRLGDGLGGFTNAPNVAVGDSPAAVAVGDFNRNGTLDLAVINQGQNTVSIRQGDGDGTFTIAVGASVGTAPMSIAAGDFNNDGRLDLAVANSGSNNVTVRLNNGGGVFQDANALTLGSGLSPSSVVVGDFNGDGRQDLAVANRDADNVVVWRNTCDLTPCGSARFRPAPGSPLATGNFPASIAVADFNLDGKPDMAVAHRLASHVAIRLGDGLGGFTSAPNVPTDSQATDLVAGDFNDDGRPDLAVLNTDPDMDFDNIAILLGDGAGGFTAAPDARTNSEGRSLVVADINRDGKLDLVVANNGSFRIAVLAGDGAGGFTQISDVHVRQDPFSVVVADFNHDGALDLAATSFIDNTAVSIRLGDGTGNFTDAPDVLVGDYSVDIAAGDFNRDGNLDLAVANRFAVFNPVSIAIRLGDGNGGFAFAPHVLAGPTPGTVEISDFNLDGKLDLLVVSNSFASVVIRLGNGDGSFTNAPDVPVGVDPVATAVADFNRDGKPDFAVANSASDNVSVLLNGCAPPADLTITQTASGNRFVAGQTVTFTFTVTNNGPYAVTGTAAA
ncbi:MAG TPA: VCBS repeat-containing protein, partial [Pyrinomonadaceae bacterium]|nr:VCBS repeat-containing protein [Pyrinomonadaceae bacterium]